MGTHFFFFLFLAISIGAGVERPKICREGVRPSRIIVCSPKCGGCQLEDGSPVTCSHLDKSEFFVLLGFRSRKNKNIILVSKISRVECVSESTKDKLSKEFLCKRSTPIRYKGRFIACVVGRADDLKPVQKGVIDRMLITSTESNPIDIRTVSAQTRTTSHMTIGGSSTSAVKDYESSKLVFHRISSSRSTNTNVTKPRPTGRSFPTKAKTTSQPKYVRELKDDDMKENRSIVKPLRSKHTTNRITWKRHKTGEKRMRGFTVRSNVRNCFPRAF